MMALNNVQYLRNPVPQAIMLRLLFLPLLPLGLFSVRLSQA